jgi:hypothetical protein
MAVYPYIEFGYALWATVQKFIKHYGPLCRILVALWTTVHNFVMHFEPQIGISLSAMGHSTEFSYAL